MLGTWESETKLGVNSSRRTNRHDVRLIGSSSYVSCISYSLSQSRRRPLANRRMVTFATRSQAITATLWRFMFSFRRQYDSCSNAAEDTA